MTATYRQHVTEEIAASRAARADAAPLVSVLAGLATHRLAQPRVRIRVGGFAGDLGRISGAGAAGGHVVTTDSGLTLYFAECDLERITKGE